MECIKRNKRVNKEYVNNRSHTCMVKNHADLNFTYEFYEDLCGST